MVTFFPQALAAVPMVLEEEKGRRRRRRFPPPPSSPPPHAPNATTTTTTVQKRSFANLQLRGSSLSSSSSQRLLKLCLKCTTRRPGRE